MKPNPSKLGVNVQSICVNVSFIVASVKVIVVPRSWVSPSVDSWFAIAPAGIEIMIAIEKPKAMITSKARIFLRDMFLTALVTIPNALCLLWLHPFF